MLKSNKGTVNLIILIVSIVVAVLVLGVVAGIIIWKVVQEEEPKRKSRNKEEEEKTVDGYRDCGVSDIFLTGDFSSPLDIDFEKDDAMVCIGKNIKNNCKDSTALVKADDFDMTYKVSGTSKSDCKIRLEVYDEGDIIYVECPLSGIISLPNISSYYKAFEDKLSGGPGDYAGCLVMMTIDVADTDWDIGEEIVGCSGNFD